jgi:hypothetical protein
MDAMLSYMYGEQDPKSESVARRLLLVADRFQMHGLLQQCQYVLAKSLSVENACEIAMLCEMLSGSGGSHQQADVFSSSDSLDSSCSHSPRSVSSQEATSDMNATSDQGSGICEPLTVAVISFIVDRIDQFLGTQRFKTLMAKCPNLVTHVMIASRSSASAVSGKKRKYNVI